MRRWFVPVAFVCGALAATACGEEIVAKSSGTPTSSSDVPTSPVEHRSAADLPVVPLALADGEAVKIDDPAGGNVTFSRSPDGECVTSELGRRSPVPGAAGTKCTKWTGNVTWQISYGSSIAPVGTTPTWADLTAVLPNAAASVDLVTSAGTVLSHLRRLPSNEKIAGVAVFRNDIDDPAVSTPAWLKVTDNDGSQWLFNESVRLVNQKSENGG